LFAFLSLFSPFSPHSLEQVLTQVNETEFHGRIAKGVQGIKEEVHFPSSP
jgi:hypothetical protein